jgi:hypothetical protein
MKAVSLSLKAAFCLSTIEQSSAHSRLERKRHDFTSFTPARVSFCIARVWASVLSVRQQKAGEVMA